MLQFEIYNELLACINTLSYLQQLSKFYKSKFNDFMNTWNIYSYMPNIPFAYLPLPAICKPLEPAEVWKIKKDQILITEKVCVELWWSC